MNSKIKSYLIFGGWAIYVSILILYWDNLILTAQTSNVLMSSILYYLTNPAYLLIICGVIKYATVTAFRKVIASIFLVVALDIVSSPRILINELNGCISMSLDTGTIFIKWISTYGISLKFANILYYWLIPIILFWLSMELLGHIQFIRKMNNGGI